ncbi:MAG: AAA family ATPase, partial [Planctomycetes bacterium]|nr:AAA family ATPase [Planctomycetota bacterium]
MKILRLDLIACGPFTGALLDFAGGEHGLHIIYGPNEAGKSSALRALRNLLYGFATQTSDAFLHPYKELRVGAVLQAEDGATLECIRRKGRVRTLRAADDTEIVEEAELARWLGGVGREAFCRQFGINYEQLVQGGEEIVAGGGEIGQILFAAASGFARLNEVRRSLASEAEALFTPAANVKPINRAIGELKQQRKRVYESQLKSSQWKEHHDRLAEAESRKKTLESEQSRRAAEFSRLERIQRALPDIARREETLCELEVLGDAPHLPPDFSERRRSAELARIAATLHRI